MSGFRLESLLACLILVRGTAQDIHRNLCVDSGRRLCAILMPIQNRTMLWSLQTSMDGVSNAYLCLP